jgi:hypothetical protein
VKLTKRSASPIRDVVLRDVTVGRTPAPHEVRHVAGLRTERVRVNGAAVSLPPTIA